MQKKYFEQTIVTVFSHLGSMISQGVPLLKSLDAIAADMEPPYVYILELVASYMRSGHSLGQSFQKLNVMPDEVIDRLTHAEVNGDLDREMKIISEDFAVGVYQLTMPGDLASLRVTVDQERQNVVETVNKLIEEAIQNRTSDLHLEPDHKGGRVRFRVDGVMKPTSHCYDSESYRAIVALLKEYSQLDVAETMRPQDGRILINLDHPIDLRISVCPFVNGEKVVIRFLDRTAFPTSLDAINISAEKLDQFRKWISNPYGVILVSGPTGSGKTTTLYLLLRELSQKEGINIITVEDPVEIQLPNTFQMQLNPRVGLTYPAALRSLFRQDPDVIGIGEIQTPEVAELMGQIAQTGHLVLSQLHARSAAATLKMMHDLGVPVHVLKEIVVGVVSQRLVRRLCPECKQPVSSSDQKLLPEPLASCRGPVYTAVGCEQCNGTGYRGREVVMELLEPATEFWAAISQNIPEDQLIKFTKTGFKTMLDDGYQRVMDGMTSPEEINRVLEG